MSNFRKKEPFVNIGASSLLVIFLTLCLVTFAVLTLSGAQSDYRFSKKLADRKTAYYTAANRGEEILEQIDRELAASYEKTGFGDYLSTAQSRLETLSADKNLSLELDFSTAEPTVFYQVVINERQNLNVKLALTPSPQSGSTFYRIIEWRTVPSETWNGDNALTLIQ